MASGTGFGKYSSKMIPKMDPLPADIDFMCEDASKRPVWSNKLMNVVKLLDIRKQ